MYASTFFSQLKTHCSNLEIDTKNLKEIVNEDQNTITGNVHAKQCDLIPMDININIFKENISNLSSNIESISIQCNTNNTNGNISNINKTNTNTNNKEGNMSMSELLLKYKTIVQSNDKMNKHLKQHYVKFGETIPTSTATVTATHKNMKIDKNDKNDKENTMGNIDNIDNNDIAIDNADNIEADTSIVSGIFVYIYIFVYIPVYGIHTLLPI